MDKDGYLKIGGRIDDIINVAGHRLSTKQIETVRKIIFFRYTVFHIRKFVKFIMFVASYLLN